MHTQCAALVPVRAWAALPLQILLFNTCLTDFTTSDVIQACRARLLRYQRLYCYSKPVKAPESQSQMSEQRAASVASMYDGFRRKDVPDISTRELWDLIQNRDEQLIILDARESSEQEVSVLPGPTVTRSQFEKDKERYRGKRIVCYCTAGLRSGMLAAQLRQQGFNAANLEGSILGWTHSGYPLVLLHDRSKESNRVHVYGPRWELQAEGYEPVMHAVPAAAAAKSILGLAASWLNPKNFFTWLSSLWPRGATGSRKKSNDGKTE